MAWRSERDEEFQAFVVSERVALVRTASILLAGDSHRAEDAVQRALARVYVAWHRIRPDGRRAYVRRTVVNEAMDEHRRSRRRKEVVTDTLPDHPAAVLDADGDSTVVRLLAELPAGMRAAVVLRHVEGLSAAEVAEILHCREGTVRSQCARGLDRLRAALTAAPS